MSRFKNINITLLNVILTFIKDSVHIEAKDECSFIPYGLAVFAHDFIYNVKRNSQPYLIS